jgi:hypothetical protein
MAVPVLGLASKQLFAFSKFVIDGQRSDLIAPPQKL